MKNLTALSLMIAMLLFGLTGCSEKEKSKSETTISTPGGKTTITHDTEVQKSGKNPPPAAP
ncbi:MAG TPA: hypothetical protein VGH74_05810 [Planctomycetaceae bacterium]